MRTLKTLSQLDFNVAQGVWGYQVITVMCRGASIVCLETVGTGGGNCETIDCFLYDAQFC